MRLSSPSHDDGGDGLPFLADGHVSPDTRVANFDTELSAKIRNAEFVGSVNLMLRVILIILDCP